METNMRGFPSFGAETIQSGEKVSVRSGETEVYCAVVFESVSNTSPSYSRISVNTRRIHSLWSSGRSGSFSSTASHHSS